MLVCSSRGSNLFCLSGHRLHV
uniref:Uncharacterized protein n=1 Tax=Arundo donax TaxID=35708 RepID=A0A0A9BUF1_ARUDO